MPPKIEWFPERIFGKQADSRLTIPLQTQQKAIAYLCSMLKDPYGVRALIGEPAAGKSTIVRGFLSVLRSDIVVAEVDGAGLSAEEFLVALLDQFGYNVELESADDLLRMLSVFAVQQTRTLQPPVIVVENVENMRPTALRALAVLASVTYQGKYALRIALTGSSKARGLLDSTGMIPVAKRLESVYEVEPLSRHEAMQYLHGRMSAADVRQPDSVLPINACDRIHELAGGHPGRINEIARGSLQEALSMPVTVADVNKFCKAALVRRSTPRLVVSLDGDVLDTYEFKESKVTIGRSSLADIVIHNEFASRFHALLLTFSDALVLVDLNSANGTLVNSIKVSSTILRSNDIISLANHRIKVLNAPEPSADPIGDDLVTDTSRMKSLEERRAEQRAKLTPVPPASREDSA